jgi:prepilin-type processing-associated H-X9-DG protein
MKQRLSNQRTGGLTLVEVVLVIFVLVVVAGVVLPVFFKAKPRRSGLNCVINLKQIGLAMRMWSNDHGDKFPWNVSTNEGGTMEFVGTTEVFHHFLATSNELTSPKVLSCPKDTQRTRAISWDQLTDDSRHISYFVGLDADESKPQSILSGDRNLTTNGRAAAGTVAITRTMAMGWTGRMHTNAGNIGFGDGSARKSRATEIRFGDGSSRQFWATELQARFQSARTNLGVDSIRLVIP